MAEAEHSIVELESNLADFEDYEPLPGRAYDAQITEAELRMKEETGNEYYYVVFTIPPGHYPHDYAVENAPEGARLVYARLQKPTTANRRSITALKNFMRTIGVSLKTNKIDPDAWVGRWAKLNIKKDTFNGDPINSIVSIEKSEMPGK